MENGEIQLDTKTLEMLRDKKWRIDHLYKIVDKNSDLIRFRRIFRRQMLIAVMIR